MILVIGFSMAYQAILGSSGAVTAGAPLYPTYHQSASPVSFAPRYADDSDLDARWCRSFLISNSILFS